MTTIKKRVYVIQRKLKNVTKYYSTWHNSHGRWVDDPVFAMHFKTQANAGKSVSSSWYIDRETAKIVQTDVQYTLTELDYKPVVKIDAKWVIGASYYDEDQMRNKHATLVSIHNRFLGPKSTMTCFASDTRKFSTQAAANKELKRLQDLSKSEKRKLESTYTGRHWRKFWKLEPKVMKYSTAKNIKQYVRKDTIK